jgi:acetaldehyde dehydrogenase (acetylating)
MSDSELISVQQAENATEAAHAAGLVLARFDQAQVDRICAAMSRAALAEAARLGAMAVEETGFGKADDKREKNRFAAEDVWNYFKNLKTVGVVSETKDVVEIASPRGVVAGIVPSTNPTSTAIFKALIAIKARNAIVMSPHPSAKRCIAETVRVLREAAIKEGLPPDALACLTETTLEATNALMRHRKTAVILATGGLGLVRAAYSSGKPAFGVGPGNVPVFVEKTADVNKAVADILTGTCFDNGTICASEQSVVVEAAIANQTREQFKQQGGHFLSSDDADKVAKILVTPERTLNPQIVGKSAEFIANLAGVSIPVGTRCLIAETGGVGREFPWSIEKLSPTLAFFVVDSIEAGAQRCLEILQFGGMGHTAGVHTRNRDAAVKYGAQMPASRIVVNSPTTHGAIGFSTALPPSMTLGCGSWGGNVTSDNVSPIHLLDIKRVAFETKPVSRQSSVVSRQSQIINVQPMAQPQQTVKREEIAAIVDKFLRQKEVQNSQPSVVNNQTREQTATNNERPTTDGAEKPKTIIHQIAASNPAANGAKKPSAIDFVSETDVKRALEGGEKIYISAKTIITPAARDLGEPAEIFVKI